MATYSNIKAIVFNGDTFNLKDTNTTYSAGDGMTLSGTTFNNAGVRSVAASTGSSNGYISVNTGGTTTSVKTCEIATLSEAKTYLGIS